VSGSDLSLQRAENETAQSSLNECPDTDAVRLRVKSLLEPSQKSSLGQFMTPSVTAEFMASLLDPIDSSMDLLDAGAGIGSLTAAAVHRLGSVNSVDAWEIDPVMRAHLELNLKALGVNYAVHRDDFIMSAVQRIAFARGRRYTHAILNPPYKKLGSLSAHRSLLRKVGIETVNLYSAFVALSLLLMQDGGQLVAIIPRSFCNGPYYKPFRRLLFEIGAVDRIHVFESRTSAFKDDEVLQENVIVKIVKLGAQRGVRVSFSHDSHLSDYSEIEMPFSEIVRPNDAEVFIHIPHGEACGDSGGCTLGLTDLNLEVSTGPVVDFRLKQFWLDRPEHGSVPLLYPHHFSEGSLQYPKQHKKPNALLDDPEVRRWLMPNERFVLVKRFSSKEERRRVVAYVYEPGEIAAARIGFENHWNVFHSNRRGISQDLARGLACFLNSTALDNRFRVFSGHTQVNATDLRNLGYPSVAALERLGDKYRDGMTQADIDRLVEVVG
jgi:adenine-specific DNA-methyltransferase